MVGAILKLMRWPNLLMIAFIQYLIRHSLVLPLNLPHFLDDLDFFLLVFWSIIQAAGAYIINDILDQETDAINKPERITVAKHIRIGLAWNLFYATILISVAIAYYLSEKAAIGNLWLISPLSAILIYSYSADLKRRAFIGNFSVALLSAIPLLLVAIFDILPAATADNKDQVRQSMEVIIAYSAFAFWTTLIREMVKDLEDREGDEKSGYQTLAILFSAKLNKALISLLLAVVIALAATYAISIWSADLSSALYILVAILGFGLYLFQKLWQAQNANDFHKLSTQIKNFMLVGILSIPFFTLSLLLQWP